MLRPPPLESEEERRLRLAAEMEAKRISDRIDENIRLEREAKKRAPMNVKVSRRLQITPLNPVLQQAGEMRSAAEHTAWPALASPISTMTAPAQHPTVKVQLWKIISKRFQILPLRTHATAPELLMRLCHEKSGQVASIGTG